MTSRRRQEKQDSSRCTVSSSVICWTGLVFLDVFVDPSSYINYISSQFILEDPGSFLSVIFQVHSYSFTYYLFYFVPMRHST